MIYSLPFLSNDENLVGRWLCLLLPGLRLVFATQLVFLVHFGDLYLYIWNLF